MAQYDYIILGAGASGLMLAYRMSQDKFFDDKSVLIIDKTKDKGNDRTYYKSYASSPRGWNGMGTTVGGYIRDSS